MFKLVRSGLIRGACTHVQTKPPQVNCWRAVPHRSVPLRRLADQSQKDNASKVSPPGAEPEKMTFSLLWKRYGAITIVTHFSVYFLTVAGLYVGVNNGLLGNDPVERKEAVESVANKLEPYIPEKATNMIRESPSVGAFAVAWLSAKFTEPIRLVVTIFLVPRIARHLGRAPPKL